MSEDHADKIVDLLTELLYQTKKMNTTLERIEDHNREISGELESIGTQTSNVDGLLTEVLNEVRG